ncbi:MAG: SDR family NAD(P)-dependent oxidoreductase [Leptospiraceae bacterium]|nr:SDR family NAD(P)-dependent oxidoreductase [Leptospiraceae bacterium]MCK6382628.1 SDR family NAD(P)-dependent oxidoreductase [Leptospiraceae bacterium]
MEKVLILAATSDIGKHIAENFAKRNYDMYLTGRDKSSLNTISTYLQKKYNVKILQYDLDITDYSSHAPFITSLPELPNIVVCSFGYYKNQEKALSDFHEAYQTMSVNYIGAVSFLNTIALYFQKRKSGIIIGISSVAGIRGRQLNFLYGSAKAGFTAYLSGLRNKLFKDKVTVTTILLGPVYTRMSEGHNLMPILTAKPEIAAKKIVESGLNHKSEVYILWHWKWIMLAIQMIPECIFKRLPSF